MQRRKFIAALGTAALGSSVAMGTGAFSSVSATRTMSVRTAEDSSALLSFVPGDTGLVTLNDGTLQMSIDGSKSAGTGVNMDAVTVIGDPENPTDDYAFKVVNRGTQSYMLKMNYYFSNTGWIENAGQNQSHLKFQLFDPARNDSSAREYPDQRGYNRDHSLGQPTGSGFGSNSGGYRFNVGDEYHMVVTVDTTGENASLDDDLSGSAVFHVDTSTSQDSWYPTDPPV